MLLSRHMTQSLPFASWLLIHQPAFLFYRPIHCFFDILLTINFVTDVLIAFLKLSYLLSLATAFKSCISVHWTVLGLSILWINFCAVIQNIFELFHLLKMLSHCFLDWVFFWGGGLRAAFTDITLASLSVFERKLIFLQYFLSIFKIYISTKISLLSSRK